MAILSLLAILVEWAKTSSKEEVLLRSSHGGYKDQWVCDTKHSICLGVKVYGTHKKQRLALIHVANEKSADAESLAFVCV